MSIRERFRSKTPGAPANSPPTTGGRHAQGPAVARGAMRAPMSDRRLGIKARVHRRMVERLNLATLDNIEPSALLPQIRRIISDLITEEQIPLSEAQREQLEQEVLNETFGLGPIEPLLHDPDVADILVNTHK